MSRLKIVAKGKSSQAQAQLRGKLFEKLMGDMLRQYGYDISKITPNINYAGMEIDIEGNFNISNIPLYAECKYYDTEVDTPKLQAFYGKFTALRFRRDKRSHGLFIAIPGINSHAKAFYKEVLEADKELSLQLLDEESVLKMVFHSYPAMHPRVIEDKVKKYGKPSDWFVVYTDQGIFLLNI